MTSTTDMTMFIDRNWLEDRGACAEHVELLAAEWPAGVTLTRAVLHRAATLGADIDWFSRHVLSAPARAEYERVVAPAWAEYERVVATARAEYERVTAPAWAEYKRVTAPAWAEYKRVTTSAWAEYKRVVATAMADALGVD